MLGIKVRQVIPVPAVSLEELVPPDHFYRHLEQVLDLTFVRQWVQDGYAANGRPSIDPVVFFKLQLVMFSRGYSLRTPVLLELARGSRSYWSWTEPVGIRVCCLGYLADPMTLERMGERIQGCYWCPTGSTASTPACWQSPYSGVLKD